MLSVIGLAFPTWFFVARLVLAFLALVGFLYLIQTWRHPRLGVAIVFTSVETFGVSVLIALSAWLAAKQGERWEPVAALQLTMAAIPVIAPPFIWVGYVLLGGFAAQLVLIELYQQYVGLGPFVGAEPFGSLCVPLAALGVLLVRKERQQIGLAYIRAQSEAAALVRLAPVLASIREELGLANRALEVVALRSDRTPGALPRSIHRLDTLRDQLDALSTPIEPPHDGERDLLTRDAQYGAFVFALLGCIVLVFAGWSTHALPVGYSTEMSLAIAVGYGFIALWLWLKRARPTIRRGVIACSLVLGSAMVLAVYMHSYWVTLDGLVFPFIGEKLILMILVVLRFPRLWIGALLIALIAASHIAIDAIFATAPIPLEPWHMLTFAAIGLGFLVMSEQRRIAKLALLRAETIKSSLHRRANLSIALCDQLNTPLQTVLGIVELQPPTSATTEAFARIEQLRASSKRLARLVEELPPDLHRVSLDSAAHLRRRV
ncbi:MAG TPA: hypothetical protein VFV99_06865 [Kofleriaceae bacterium]|nr:hypothetical protein [Kofleriaceae bacterium]